MEDQIQIVIDQNAEILAKISQRPDHACEKAQFQEYEDHVNIKLDFTTPEDINQLNERILNESGFLAKLVRFSKKQNHNVLFTIRFISA